MGVVMMFCSMNEDSKGLEFYFHCVMKLHRAKFIELISDLEFFPGQVPILAAINKNNGCKQKDIGGIVMFKPASITDALKRMEKNGLIQRKNDEDDLRIVRVFITELGKKQLKEAIKINKEVEEICFMNFTNEEKKKFRDFLKKVIINLESGEKDNA